MTDLSKLPEGIEPWVPPTLVALLARCDEQYHAVIREAYQAGAEAGKPYVSVDPAMRFGRPCVNKTRLSVQAVAGMVWAGESVDVVAEEYHVTRPDVIVACWYAGKYGTSESKAWRRRWGKWADEVHDQLWHSRYDVPDPPDMNGEQ